MYAVISAFFAGLVAIFGKIGLKNIDSTVATTVRSVVMVLFLILVVTGLGKWQQIADISGKALYFIILSGVSGALSWLFYFYALKQGNVAGVAVVDRMSIIFAIIFAALFIGEALTWKSVIAMFLVLVGGILMII
jgi:bacterial/archaeal transporter family protein